MADYQYNGPEVEDGVIRSADGATIPNDVANDDWGAYLAYVDGGGETDPWKTQAELDAIAVETLRKLEIEDEKSGDELDRKTLAQIDARLDIVYDLADYDAATDFAGVKSAIRALLLRQKRLSRKIAIRVVG